MNKSIAIILAMLCLSAFLMLTSGCDTKPAAAKNVNATHAPKAAMVEKKIKAKKTEKIVKVIDINGSTITYSLGKGRKRKFMPVQFRVL